MNYDIYNCYIFFVHYGFMTDNGFVYSWFTEQKKQKVSEIKAGLDDADALVL